MNEKTYDPAQLASHLEQSFGAEPPHAELADDLRVGRRRLLRHRATTAAGGLAVTALVAGAAAVVPTVLPDRPTSAGPAASVAAPLTDREIVAGCLRPDNVMAGPGQEGANPAPEPAPATLLGARPRLMTHQADGGRVLATLLGEDGKHWEICQLPTSPDAGAKSYRTVYETRVTFPRAVVDGVHAYRPASESDPRLAASADPPIPQFEVTCSNDQPEETAARYQADAACPSYLLTWVDRRPADVARATVVGPDGRELDADVRDGYLTLVHEGSMTPGLAAQVARGEKPQVRRVTFYDQDGNVLVVDRDPGHYPVDGHLSMANFPSLAWWLKD